jgi:cytochrome b6-f complex iron-sulfur subunit
MAAAQATSASSTVSPMTRREFLYYIWFGSMALLTAQAGAALLWFAYPRFKAGTFGGIFEIDIAELPPVDAAPKAFSGGRFWLVNIGDGIVGDARQPATWRPAKGAKALYMICVHLGCLYSWIPTNNRFECPCHGSKYLSSGTAVAGPANRNLDVFEMEAVDDAGTVIDKTEVITLADNTTEGRSISIEGATRLRINTGKRINGASNPTPSEGNA